MAIIIKIDTNQFSANYFYKNICRGYKKKLPLKNNNMNESKMNLKVGDKAKVICQKNGHKFSIGEIITIIAVDDSSEDYYCMTEVPNKNGWYLRDNELEKIEVPNMNEKLDLGKVFDGECDLVNPVNGRGFISKATFIRVVSELLEKVREEIAVEFGEWLRDDSIGVMWFTEQDCTTEEAYQIFKHQKSK